MEKCHVLFPGKFKPFHDGHMSLIKKYLDSDKYDADITVIISKVDKDGLSAKTTKWFLDKIFKGSKRVRVMVSRDNSPVATAYDMTGEKEYGDGIYAMCSSSKHSDKESDDKRADDFKHLFSKGAKYYTKGVQVISFPVDSRPLKYTNRPGSNAVISASTIRMDAKDNDYEMFKCAYRNMLKNHDIDEGTLEVYFNKIRNEIKKENESLNEEALYRFDNALFEGGVAGHMQHPYEIEDWTFKDLKNLITDIFAGRITDVTEKLDGQNLFASVDTNGNTIFARSEKQLFESPWYLDDVKYNPKWIGNPKVQHAFTNAATTVDKIFSNIPNKVDFFNYDDRADGVRYRDWANLEIIDTQNFNVIPYAESKISFHSFHTACVDYQERDAISNDNYDKRYDTFECPDNEEKMNVLDRAIKKTNHTAFSAQITPKIIFKKIDNGNAKAEKYIREIDKILGDGNMGDLATIEDYKEEQFIRALEGTRMSFIDNEVLTGIIQKWIHNEKGIRMTDLYKMKLSTGDCMSPVQKKEFQDFVKTDLPNILKRIMKPLDRIFIKLGNEVLKSVKGLENAGHETDVIRTLRREMNDIATSVAQSDDVNKKRKLQSALERLANVNNELNSTEGIIFKYNGRLMKLTGSFAPLNQLFGMKAGKFNR